MTRSCVLRLLSRPHSDLSTIWPLTKRIVPRFKLFPLNNKGSKWGSFLIKGASGFNIFVAGDAAYFNRYKELGNEFSIDLAIFNLGAYEPRWFMATSHMNPEETVRAFLDLKARHLLVVHWGSFRLGDEPVHFPPLQIKREMEKEGILDRLIHLDHGKTLLYDNLNV